MTYLTYIDTVIIAFFSVSQGSCLSGWYEVDKFCFRFVQFLVNDITGKQILNTARKKCLETGADLAVPRTQYLLTRIVSASQVQSWNISEVYQRPLLLGANDSLHVDWKWSDGSRVNSAVWGPGEPNTKFGKCGVMANLAGNVSYSRAWTTVGGWWLAATYCDQRKGFICETLPGNNKLIPVNIDWQNFFIYFKPKSLVQFQFAEL